MDDLKYFVPITKRDDEQRMVWGRASTPCTDSQGDRVAVKAIEDAWPEYSRFGNVREMHQLSAVGKTKTVEFDDQGALIGAKVVDDNAWKKIKEGVYNGFSIGGRVTKRDPDDKTLITGINLVEISLVDRPANPECVFDVWKADVATDAPNEQTATLPDPPKEEPKTEAPVVEAAQEAKVAAFTMGDGEDEYLRRCAAIGIDHSKHAIHRLINPYIN